jgi:glycosyltransferase involved in cell wall biosynthesis
MWRRKRDIYTHSHLYLVCPSHWLEKEVSASILADGAAELCVIPNGVDEQLFCPANRDAKALARTGLGIEADEFVVAFCAVAGSDGRNPDKDPLTLVHALRQLATLSKRRRFCLLIIGDIALEDTELAGGDGLRLIRTGRLAGGRAVAGALAAADLYAHAAFAENFPLALLEAAACGLACVASDVGGAAEIIEAGVSGLLVALQDTNGWVEALGRLVDDVELRRGFAQAGRARIERKFSCTRMVESYLELYLRASEDHARWREQEGGV